MPLLERVELCLRELVERLHGDLHYHIRLNGRQGLIGKRQMAGDNGKSTLEHIWLPYAQMKTAAPPLTVVRTHGSRIVLADGRELIDGVASWWTACHGYNQPTIRHAVAKQLKQMPHVMFGGLAHEPALTLARRLVELLPGDLERVFFSDSGSVAVEVALKMAIQFWRNRGQAGRARFVTFRGGYHGDTTGAMAVSDPDDSMHALFKGLLPEQVNVALPTD